MTPDELEALVGRKLGRLPDPRAPVSLLPGILAEVRRSEVGVARDRSRTGLRWVAQAAMVVAITVVAVLAGSAYQQGVLHDLWALAGAAGLIWRVFVEPMIVPAAVLVGLLGAMSALSCGILSRMLWERGIE